MRPTEAQITSSIRDLAATKGYKRSEKTLDHVAVCLVGHRHPVPVAVGSNATKCPVWVRASRSPADAAKEFDKSSPIHPVVVLAYVWTRSDADARRLKAALDLRIIGDDPEMTVLRHWWRDLPEWEVSWPILLQDAMSDLREGGEKIEVFSDEMRAQRIINHMQRGME